MAVTRHRRNSRAPLRRGSSTWSRWKQRWHCRGISPSWPENPSWRRAPH